MAKANAQTEATEGAAEDKPKGAKRNGNLIAVTVPDTMNAIIEQLAKDQNKPKARVVLEVLASTYNVELPVATRTREKKYANPEEAKAAAQEKRTKASALLAALEAGELDADLATILAKFAPKPRQRKAKDEDEASAEGATVADGEPASV